MSTNFPFVGSDGELKFQDGATTEVVVTTSADHVFLAGSTDTTGATDRAFIQTTLNAGKDVTGSGIVYIDQTITIPSGRTLTANLVVGSNWNDSGVNADDRTVAMVRIRGAASGTVNTTLNGATKFGATSIILASASGANLPPASSWLKITGTEGPTGDDSASTIVNELVQVSSAYVSGTTITLAENVYMSHATASTVVSITPVIGARFIGSLDTGNKTIPVGIEITDCYDVQLDIAGARGFTRAVVDAKGSKNCIIPEIINLGDCNGVLFLDSCHNVVCSKLHSTGKYGRYAASGVTRYQAWFYNHCVDIKISEMHCNKISGLYRQWGGIRCGVSDWSATDVNISQIISTSPANEGGGGGPTATLFGSILDGGCGPINTFTAFGFGCFFGNGTASNVVHAGDGITAQVAFHVHDHREFQGGNWTLDNMGGSPSSAGSYVQGIAIKDSIGTLGRIILRGVNRALTLYGFPSMYIQSLQSIATSGDGSLGNIFIQAEWGGGTGTGPLIGVAKADNYSVYLGVGTDFDNNPDRCELIREMWLGNRLYRNIRLSRCDFSGADQGKVCRATGIAAETTIEATGPHRTNSVYVSGRADVGLTGHAWALVADGDAYIAHTGTAAVVGDLLVAAGSSGNVQVNNSPSTGSTIWRATRASSGGFVQASRVGVIEAFTSITGNSLVSTGDLTLTAASGSALKLKEGGTDLFSISDTAGTASITGPANSSGVVLGIDIRTDNTAGSTINIQGQMAKAGSQSNGGGIRLTPGYDTSSVGISSPGVLTIDLGAPASLHGGQCGAVTYNDNLGIAVDSGLVGIGGDLNGALYYRWGGAATGSNGRTRGVGFRIQPASAEISLEAAGGANGYIQHQVASASTIGHRWLIDSNVRMQILDSDITLATATGNPITIKDNTTAHLNISLASSITTIAGSGSSGTLLSSSTSHLTLNAPSGSAVKITEGGTAVAQIEDVSGVSTITLQGVSGSRIIGTTVFNLAVNAAGKFNFQDNTTAILEMQLSGGDTYLTGMGTNQIIRANTGNLTLQAASGSALKLNEGATAVLQVEDISTVATISGKGAGGTEFNSTTGDMTLRVPSAGLIKMYEGTDNVWNFDYDTPNTAGRMATSATVGWIQAPILYLKGTSSTRVVDPSGSICFYADSSGPVVGDYIHGYSKNTVGTSGYINRVWGAVANALHNIKEYYGNLLTTDATTATALSITLPTSAVLVTATIVATDATTANGAAFEVKAAFRTAGGTTTLIGTATTVSVGADVSLATATATLDATGSTCRVRVTGVAATNLRWECYTTVSFVGPYV